MSLVHGVCQFCRVTEKDIDGDRLSWLNGAMTCCNKPSCAKQYHAQIRRAAHEFRTKNRKKTPAEIYELQRQEHRERNRRYREAAKARGLIRPKGGAA